MRSAGRTRLLAVGCVAALLLLVAAAEWVPRLLHESVAVTSTPVPDDMPQPAALAVGAGQRACLRNVVVDPDTARALIAVARAAPQPSPPLQLEIDGPGYRVRERVQQADPTQPRLVVPVPSPRSAVPTTVCVRNLGAAVTQLDATADPRVFEQTSRAEVDGVVQPSAFLLTFTEGKPSDALERLPETFRRAALFSAAGTWLYWLLLPLVALGVPALIVFALYGTIEDDDVDDDDAA